MLERRILSDLKQSCAERKSTAESMEENKKKNELLSVEITGHGLQPTKNRILKMKLWKESGGRCIYCLGNMTAWVI